MAVDDHRRRVGVVAGPVREDGRQPAGLPDLGRREAGGAQRLDEVLGRPAHVRVVRGVPGDRRDAQPGGQPLDERVGAVGDRCSHPREVVGVGQVLLVGGAHGAHPMRARARRPSSASVGPVRLATFNLLGGRSVAHGARRGGRAAVGGVVAGRRRRGAAGGRPGAAAIAPRRPDRGRGGRRWAPRRGASCRPCTAHPGEAWTAAAGDGSGEQPPGPAYGIGLVSRHPVTSWAVRRFKPAPVGLPLLVPGQGLMHVDDEPRAALAARVETPAGR